MINTGEGWENSSVPQFSISKSVIIGNVNDPHDHHRASVCDVVVAVCDDLRHWRRSDIWNSFRSYVIYSATRAMIRNVALARNQMRHLRKSERLRRESVRPSFVGGHAHLQPMTNLPNMRNRPQD